MEWLLKQWKQGNTCFGKPLIDLLKKRDLFLCKLAPFIDFDISTNICKFLMLTDIFKFPFAIKNTSPHGPFSAYLECEVISTSPFYFFESNNFVK